MNGLIFDSHAHYDDKAFDPDRGELLAALPQNGVGGVVNCGASLESSRTAVALAEAYPYVYAAVGVHPEEVKGVPEDYLEQLERLAAKPKVVAVGEIGLDYYWKENASPDVQKRFFEGQLLLAKRLCLPVIIHDREAHEDMTRLLLTEGQGVRGVLHCFSGDWAMAETFIKAGWYFGFGGTSTFKNDHGVREILRKMPLDRIVFETDSPYMAPVPYRGKRNNPLYVKLVAEMAAEVKGIPVLSMMEIATKNSQNLFPKLKSY